MVMETLAFILTCNLYIGWIMLLLSECTNVVVILTQDHTGELGGKETWPCVSILYFNLCVLNSVAVKY